MDDKLVDNIDWETGALFVAVARIEEARRQAERSRFEYEEQMDALKAYIDESPEDAYRTITGRALEYPVSPAEAGEAFRCVLSQVGMAVSELVEAFRRMGEIIKSIAAPENSLSESFESLEQAAALFESGDDALRQRYWKSYRCPQHRKQNIHAFQNIPCGYIAPLPRRNSRVMTRRTC